MAAHPGLHGPVGSYLGSDLCMAMRRSHAEVVRLVGLSPPLRYVQVDGGEQRA
ncbi:MAG: hypothetical protein ACTHKL_07525 [Streptosporangiaceae bacterium]